MTIPLVVSFLLGSSPMVFADPAAPAEPQRSDQQTADKPTTTLLVVRRKDNPSEFTLVDARKPEPVQAAPKPPSVVAPEPRPQANAGAVSQVQTPPAPPAKPEPKPEQKPVPKPEPKPAVKPAPAPRKQSVAPKPKSPAPKAALKKPAPSPKPKTSAPKPDARKQSIVSRVVKAAGGLVSRALSWIGTRYVWGGMSSAGVDCSGLTSLIYKTVGVKLPHNARQQFKLGRSVARSSLSAGDLVFFNISGPISHVGIYIGNNKFVHAANKRRGVRTDSLGSSYYSKRYAGARRYI